MARLIELGKKYNLPTPVNEQVVAQLQERVKEVSEAKKVAAAASAGVSKSVHHQRGAPAAPPKS